MSGTELATPQHEAPPFARGALLPSAANVGAVSIEQERAIAEAQGQLVLAKRFPRDENKSYADVMRACKSKAFAEAAFYNVPRAGGTVSGPSIRLAEEIARAYGNFQYGHRELSRSEGKSEVEVFAWDMEKNNRATRQITVMHVIDTKNGAKPCRDQKEIDDKIANVASKQARGRILALLPKWLVEEAIQECKKTLAGNNDEPIETRVLKMIQAFGKYGVNVNMLERFLGHSTKECTSDELVELLGIFNSIKEGTPPSEFFGAEESADQADAAKALAETASAAPQAAQEAPKASAAAARRQATKAAAEPAADTKPAAEPKQEAAPAQQESKPAEEVSKPAKEEAAPAAETKPAESEPAPEKKAEPAPAPQEQTAPAPKKDEPLF